MPDLLAPPRGTCGTCGVRRYLDGGVLPGHEHPLGGRCAGSGLAPWQDDAGEQGGTGGGTDGGEAADG